MRLTLIELDYHAEVLRNLCAVLDGTGIEVTVLASREVARAAGGAERFGFARWETPAEGESTAAFLARHDALVQGADAVVLNTLASRFRFFSGWTCRPPLVLRVHNASTYLNPDAGWTPIWTPFFLWKDASHWVRKELGERERLWRRCFMDRVDYVQFPDAAIESAVREAGWLEGRRTLPPVPFALHQGGFDKAPDPAGVRFTVIGGIDPRRRDYATLLEALRRGSGGWRTPATLSLLGRPRGAYGRRMLRAFRALERPGFSVEAFDAFVPQDAFERVLADTDFLVIPALERTRYTLYEEAYGRTKISGNVYDMIRYGKPSLLPEHYALDADVAAMTDRYAGADGLAERLAEWIDGPGLAPRRAAVPDAVARFRPEAARARALEVFGRLAASPPP